MERPYFEESQWLRQTRWIWFILVPGVLALLIPLLYGLYWQLAQGESWGNEPMSDAGLITISLLTVAGLVGVLFIILSVKLETRVDRAGIHYKFFPNKPKWNQIRKTDILEIEVRKKRNILTMGIVGFHKNIFKKTLSMTISGKSHLYLRLHTNQRVMIGTQHPEELERALKRFLSNEAKL